MTNAQFNSRLLKNIPYHTISYRGKIRYLTIHRLEKEPNLKLFTISRISLNLLTSF